MTDRSRDVPCVVDKMMDILTKLVNKTSIFMDQSLDLMSKDDITGTAETTTASKSTADGTLQRPSTTDASLFFYFIRRNSSSLSSSSAAAAAAACRSNLLSSPLPLSFVRND